jgi:hypothetical protein
LEEKCSSPEIGTADLPVEIGNLTDESDQSAILTPFNKFLLGQIACINYIFK